MGTQHDLALIQEKGRTALHHAMSIKFHGFPSGLPDALVNKQVGGSRHI